MYEPSFQVFLKFSPPFHHTLYVVHGWPFMIFSPFDIFILFKVGTMKYSTIEWISFFNRNKCTITLYTNLIPWKVSHRCINCIFQKKDRKLDAETFLGLWILWRGNKKFIFLEFETRWFQRPKNYGQDNITLIQCEIRQPIFPVFLIYCTGFAMAKCIFWC